MSCEQYLVRPSRKFLKINFKRIDDHACRMLGELLLLSDDPQIVDRYLHDVHFALSSMAVPGPCIKTHRHLKVIIEILLNAASFAAHADSISAPQGKEN